MERKRVAGFGLALGLFALSGCVAPAPGVVAIGPTQVAVAPPVAPMPVAVMPPPGQPVVLAPPKRHVATVHRTVTRRHWVKRYHSARAYPLPMFQCGSEVHPCNPEHVEPPFP